MSFIHIPTDLSTVFDKILVHQYKNVNDIKDTEFCVRPERIELSSHPWQGRVLPLNHDR